MRRKGEKEEEDEREAGGRGSRADRGSRSGERREKNEREGGRKIGILYLLAGHSWMGCRLGTHCKTG